MKNCFFTISTADHFQYYIPMYVAALRTWSKDKIIVCVRGEVDPLVKKLSDAVIIENKYTDYPYEVSTTNALRFIAGIDSCDNVMITDLDMLLFEDPWQWHLSQLQGKCFFGHHGPYKKPHRPEICDSWTGDYERVSGGMFCVTDEWWGKTHLQRMLAAKRLHDSVDGLYREADEVMLANIIKKSGMEVPKSKYLPTKLRGLHIGDFKFDHRWKDEGKMLTKLSIENCKKYELVREVVELMKEKSPEIKEMMDKVDTYVAGRVK